MKEKGGLDGGSIFNVFPGRMKECSEVVLAEREGIDVGDKLVDTYSNNCGIHHSGADSIASNGGKFMD